MSESEISLGTCDSWRPVSVGTQNVTDGLNLRELVLEGLDRSTKSAIIDFLKGYQLDVAGVDNDTYTVDLTKWDRNKSEQFVQMLKAMGGKLPDMIAKDDEEPECETSETVLSIFTTNDSTDQGKIIFEDSVHVKEPNIPRMERRLQPHPADELDFEYHKNSRPFPIQTNPIFQRDELLNIKPMLLKEDTQSTMGSVNMSLPTINKKFFSLKCLVNCLKFPFVQLKRLKIWRFIRKHLFKSKSKEEKMRKEKAFAVYTTLLEEGPRFGRAFRDSLQDGPGSAWKTVATSTWPPPCDDWSLNSDALKVNRGINAVPLVSEIGINTCLVKAREGAFLNLKEIPKILSEPQEEEAIIWCPCQFITSSFLYKCISKCLNYICHWEDCNTESLKKDIANQKEELTEVRSMLIGALELLEKSRKSNN